MAKATKIDLVTAIQKLATDSAPVVSSDEVRVEWLSLGIDGEERKNHPGAVYNGPAFQAADNDASRNSALLKWRRSDSHRIGWSLPVSGVGIVALREHALSLGWVPHPDSSRVGDLIERGVTAVERIATALDQVLKHGDPWTSTDPTFEEQMEGEQYGYSTLLTLDDRLDFGIWLDRTAVLDQTDVPILSAAFGAYSKVDGEALVAIAESEGARLQRYLYGQDERVLGFGREPVIDVPSNVARFLSSYRPAGNFDVDEAVKQFLSFWKTWAHKVSPIVALPRRQRTLRADWKGRALRGLAGELAVLARPDMVKATWVGMHSGAHDIERGRLLIEVKTRSGETVTLSRSQIESGPSERYFVAIVELPQEAQLVLRGTGEGNSKPHPIVEKHREGIETYLRNHGVKPEVSLLEAVSRAVRLSVNATTFHRLVPPAGFDEALAAIERFGRVADLAIDCGPEWFQSTELPK